MSDSVYVGKNVAELARNQKFDTITRVTIEVDNDKSYTAGNSTGRVLTIKNPWGTQAMATNILSIVSGFQYQPYQATDAILDPAAEIGDAITIGGIYSVIADTDITFDRACFTNITAAQGEEIDSEYPYLPPIERKVQQAQNTANDAMSIAEEAQSTANSAQTDADSANNIINGWRYPGSSVQIDGANIKAGTVTASEIQGGVISLINGNEVTAGDLTLGSASSADYAITLNSGGGLRLTASGNLYASSSSGAHLLIDSEVRSGGNLRPNGNAVYSCGTGAYHWTEIYAETGSINTSDKNLKENIHDLSGYEEFYSQINPVAFKYKNGKRMHIGFIAQEIEQTLIEHNISTNDFAGFVKYKNNKDADEYGLRYSEFIALNTYHIQKAMREIKKLQERIQKLETRLEELNG